MSNHDYKIIKKITMLLIELESEEIKKEFLILTSKFVSQRIKVKQDEMDCLVERLNNGSI